MEGKKVLLSINPQIYGLLAKKAEKNYMSIQEYVNDLIRKDVLAPMISKSNAGRPHKLDEFKILSRKKIFADHGGARIKL
jgi:hypothetical protein